MTDSLQYTAAVGGTPARTRRSWSRSVAARVESSATAAAARRAGCHDEVCYGERGLAGARVAVWVWDGTVTIEYDAETLAQYSVAFAADGRRLREVGEPRLYATGHASPQPFLSPLDEVEWHRAQRLAPYRPRRKNADAAWQEPLFDREDEASVGRGRSASPAPGG